MVRWVVQSNLLAEDDIANISSACAKAGFDFEPVQVVPFSDELPKFTLDDKTNIYYGSTVFIAKLDELLGFPDGIFFCSKAFQMSNYNARWGKHMLNFGAIDTTLGEFPYLSNIPGGDLFVRPNADDKSFAGEVMTDIELFEWAHRVRSNEETERIHGNVPSLTINTPILVGPAYRVEREWRNFIIDGKVVASTLYRKDHKLFKRREAPQEMLDFVHARCREYTPHRIFVMDIALCDNSYYIVECGCFNSVGFYCADIDVIVEAVGQASL